MTPHPFQRDHTAGIDHKERAFCRCGRREDNEEHTMPEVTDDTSARILGEGTNEEHQWPRGGQ